MDKKNSIRRVNKRSSNSSNNDLIVNYWDCSVCTYKNTPEAFKCLMCDVRKGTSTRKPRLNQAMVAQQVVAVTGSNSSGTTGGGDTRSGTTVKRSKGSSGGRSSSGQRSRGLRRPARLRNIDRSSAQAREVTVNSITVVITEYRRRPPQQHASDIDEDSSDTRP